MKNKIFIFIISLFLIFLLNINFTDAFFTRSHEYAILKSFETIDSKITQDCRPYIKEFIAGNNYADAFVLFYFSEGKSSSYLFTHQKASGIVGLQKAGSDMKQKCFVMGIMSHQVQDFYSHNQGGMVGDYLKKQAGINFIGHMRIESSAESQFFKLKKDDPIVKSGKLEEVELLAFNSIFDETGGDSNLLTLLTDITNVEGVDVSNTVSIFRCGYLGIPTSKCLKEETRSSEGGFENTVYIDKVKLPFWMWGVSIGMILLGLSVSILVLIFGKTKWKYITALFWGILLVLGIIILSSFIFGFTWQLTTLLLKSPIPYLQVSESDTIFYYDKMQKATDNFLQTGQLPFDDASGLSYVDSKSGRLVTGALIKAQSTAKIVYMIVIPLLILLINIYLFRKSFFIKNKK